ncbi:MAG: SpoIIE family protein phosphatase [Chloroflexi bacterium]|nr:SpoIIE family protein phosphatase [Chloroflexota bacterium]MBV9546214.1 SpoIIE family protein phosphatase [Chloroflexota bacterium]
MTTTKEKVVDLAAEVQRLETELEQMTVELIGVQDQLLAVFDLARATRRGLNLDSVLVDLVEEVRRLAGAELAFVVLTDPRTDELVCHPPVVGELRALFELVHRWTTAAGASLVANAPTDLPVSMQPGLKLRNIVAAPVTVYGQPHAVLGVLNRRDGDFSAGTVKLLEALAEQTGAIVETSLGHEQDLERERLEREMQLAAVMQASLMAQGMPQIPGIELVGRYRPATEVGGDFYDARLRRDGRLSFVVADVSGKGLAAAMLMGISRTVLRVAGLLVRTAAGVIDQSNLHLYEDLTGVGNFVTAFAGHYSPEAHTLTYANAGHSPVVYRPRSGQARLLAATCMPLGIVPDLDPQQLTVPLEPGELLVVATDGFPEATSPDEQLFGYDRFLSLVDEFSQLPAAAVADELFAAVDRFSAGRPQDDDQTLIIIKAHEDRSA